jgi:Rrf2 family protein
MKAKYALRALTVLAKNDSGMMQIRNIAEAADVPHKFLETILQDLRHRGVVNSKRGVFGGYFLSQKPEEITVGNIIRIIDGPLAPIRCASVTAYQKCDDCVDEKSCSIRKVMMNVRNAIADVLDRCTIQELSGMENQNFDYLNYMI